jgi:hypothetical protein
MKEQSRLFLITIILLLPSILHAIPALSTISGLESNIIILSNSNQSDSQLYISSLTSTFATVPKIALGTYNLIKPLLDFQEQTPTLIHHFISLLKPLRLQALSYHGKEAFRSGKE